jgi:hypothetical protein
MAFMQNSMVFKSFTSVRVSARGLIMSSTTAEVFLLEIYKCPAMGQLVVRVRAAKGDAAANDGKEPLLHSHFWGDELPLSGYGQNV